MGCSKAILSNPMQNIYLVFLWQSTFPPVDLKRVHYSPVSLLLKINNIFCLLFAHALFCIFDISSYLCSLYVPSTTIDM